MNPCAHWQRLSQCLPSCLSHSLGRNKLGSAVKAETAIQDLYSLALAISGLICLAFVGTGRSTAKTVENEKKNIKEGAVLN